MNADTWRKRIVAGQQDALRRYGHLSGDELREMGRKGKIRRSVVEYLIGASPAARRVSEPGR